VNVPGVRIDGEDPIEVREDRHIRVDVKPVGFQADSFNDLRALRALVRRLDPGINNVGRKMHAAVRAHPETYFRNLSRRRRIERLSADLPLLRHRVASSHGLHSCLSGDRENIRKH
jgi:hypothetical protein